MHAALISIICIVIYTICFGIFVAICNFSKIYDNTLKMLCKNKVGCIEIEGILLTIAPLSLVLMLLIYLGYGAYYVTKSLFIIFKTEI